MVEESERKFKFNTVVENPEDEPELQVDNSYSRRMRRKNKDIVIERDADGKEINPYIPQFIAKAPWYIDQSGEISLRHQRSQKDRDKIEADLKDVWYKRGVKAGPAATKYRKGACENCGAITHKTKDCMERPRKVGAKWTGQDIQADDLLQEVPMTWDSKRDRWNGYDASDHAKVIQEYERLEELSKSMSETKEDGSDIVNDMHDEDDSKIPGQGFDSDARMSTRTLRIREDTAKYLKNLNSRSEQYNPKSRTMRSIKEDVLTANDGFVRQAGEAEEFERLKQFAWDSTESGKHNVHLQANPTEGVLYKRKYEEETQKNNEKVKRQLLEKYGGSEYIKELPSELKVQPSEDYVEYTASGELLRGKEKAVPRSKYPEDIYPGNHTSVWGSFWDNFAWGYACCHSMMKQSYCTGSDGIRAAKETVIL
ncbi:mRNA splicing protein [Dipodascopsis uninucleata]